MEIKQFIKEELQRLHKATLLKEENSNIYISKYGAKTIRNPIIPDAIEVLSKDPRAVKFTHRGNFEAFLDKQKYFSASESHCFYSMEDEEAFHHGEDQWRQDNSGISEADKGSEMKFETGHELVSVWDGRNSVGYILPKESLTEEIENVRTQDPMKIADALVAAGVIKDDYTNLSGKKASSKLGFIIEKIMKSV